MSKPELQSQINERKSSSLLVPQRLKKILEKAFSNLRRQKSNNRGQESETPDITVYTLLVESFLKFTGQSLDQDQVASAAKLLATPVSRRQFLNGSLSFSGLFMLVLTKHHLDTSSVGTFLTQRQLPELQTGSPEQLDFRARFFEDIRSIELEFIDGLDGQLQELGEELGEVLAPLGFQERWSRTVFSVIENLKLLKMMSIESEKVADSLQDWSQDFLQAQFYELGSAVWAVLQLYYSFADRKEELGAYVTAFASPETPFEVDLTDFITGNEGVPILLADQVLSLNALWTSFALGRTGAQPDPVLKLLSGEVSLRPSLNFGVTPFEEATRTNQRICGLGMIPTSHLEHSRDLTPDFVHTRKEAVERRDRPAVLDISTPNPILLAKIMTKLRDENFHRLVSQLILTPMEGEIEWGGGGQFWRSSEEISVRYAQHTVDTTLDLDSLPTDSRHRQVALEAYYQNIEIDETTLLYVIFHEFGHALYHRMTQILNPADKLRAIKLVEELLRPFRRYDDLDFFAQYLPNQFLHNVNPAFYGQEFNSHTVADYSITTLLSDRASYASVAGSPEVRASYSGATMGCFNLLSKIFNREELFFIFRDQTNTDYANLSEWWSAKFATLQRADLLPLENTTLELVNEKINAVAWPTPDGRGSARIFPYSEFNLVSVILIQIFKERDPRFVAALDETIRFLPENKQKFIRHAFDVSLNQLGFITKYADIELFGQVVSYGILGENMESGELPQAYDHDLAKLKIKELRNLLEDNALARNDSGAGTVV